VQPLPEAPMLVMPIRCQKPQGVFTRRSGLAPGQGGRLDEKAGGEILSAHVYCMEEE
jgi:hypothetical protein